MLSYALSTASSYFHLPIDEEEDRNILGYERKYLAWNSPSSSSSCTASTSASVEPEVASMRGERDAVLLSILSTSDLYAVLGLARTNHLDKGTLRRAYLARSRACHPDKFPSNLATATLAFQKIALAYDVLSKPSSKRAYDTNSKRHGTDYDVFSTRSPSFGDETFRTVVISVFNDFLEGDLEIVRGYLNAINDMNPSLGLGDDGIDKLLGALLSVRERAISHRPLLLALHVHLTNLLDLQHALFQLSYFDVLGRVRLSVGMVRIVVQMIGEGGHLTLLIRTLDSALGRIERVLGGGVK
ncbi:hypothetical protein C8J56DRAFT_249414 [Mycena floridula]|nr:hypothetical protein C8J56DRAFT_249414 [Mycena floridula]